MEEIIIEHKSDINYIQNYVIDNIYKYYNSLNIKLDIVETISTEYRPFSIISILCIKGEKYSRHLVAKTIIDHPLNKREILRENQAQIEYNILSKLIPIFEKVECCSVPKPILVIPEINTCVMEYVAGTLLVNELRWVRYFSPNKRFNKLAEQFFICGKWLYYFQESTKSSDSNFEGLGKVIQRAENRLQLIQNSGNKHIAENFYLEIQSFLYGLLDDLKEEKIPMSGRHSDFHSWNILANKKKITVIDFFGYEEDCIAVDLLKMLIHLEDDKTDITTNPLLISKLQKSFLNGYGKLPYIPKQAIIICEAMQRIVSLWGNISRKEISPIRNFENSMRINKHIKWLLYKRENSFFNND